MKTIDLIPHSAPAEFELPGGFTARVVVEHDDGMGEPWKEHDGHGPVSEWRSLESKQAGERVLHTDHRSARFYDFAGACFIARRDGWGFKGQYDYKGGKYTLTPEARKMTPKARAARAAEEDFNRLRAWCNGEWEWISVGVTVTAPDGREAVNWCGGIESDSDYWREVAADLTEEGLAELADKQRAADVRRCFI